MIELVPFDAMKIILKKNVVEFKNCYLITILS
jgi:hypothetical protein